jgi:hypothetical protein
VNGTTTGQLPAGRWYEIRLEGRLDARWSVWFDGLTLTAGPDGTTTLRGPVVDQAALHGLLQRLRDLGLPLLAVTQLEPDDPPTQPNPEDPPDQKPGATS